MMLITGATGVLGSRFVATVRNRDNIRCLVRKTSDISLLNGCDVVYGITSNKEDVIAAAQGCDSILHLFPLLESRTTQDPDEAVVRSMKCVLAACKKHGIKRVVSVRQNLGNTKNLLEQAQDFADQLLMTSGLDWTMLQTGFLYGPEQYGILQYSDVMKRAPFIPVVGTGKQQIQPVAVSDVVKAIQQTLRQEQSIQKTYQLYSKPIAFEEFIDTLAATYALAKRKVHLPPAAFKAYAFLTANAGFLNKETVEALAQDSQIDASQMEAELGMNLVPFQEGIKQVSLA